MSDTILPLGHSQGGLGAGPESETDAYGRMVNQSTDRPWLDAESAPEGEDVETAIIDDDGARMVQTLTRRGRLWFVPSGAMYVYYTPTHWRPVS